jgi:hypothetical protein
MTLKGAPANFELILASPVGTRDEHMRNSRAAGTSEPVGAVLRL